jgi:hypothetical protein
MARHSRGLVKSTPAGGSCRRPSNCCSPPSPRQCTVGPGFQQNSNNAQEGQWPQWLRQWPSKAARERFRPLRRGRCSLPTIGPHTIPSSPPRMCSDKDGAMWSRLFISKPKCLTTENRRLPVARGQRFGRRRPALLGSKILFNCSPASDMHRPAAPHVCGSTSSSRTRQLQCGPAFCFQHRESTTWAGTALCRQTI